MPIGIASSPSRTDATITLLKPGVATGVHVPFAERAFGCSPVVLSHGNTDPEVIPCGYRFGGFEGRHVHVRYAGRLELRHDGIRGCGRLSRCQLIQRNRSARRPR